MLSLEPIDLRGERGATMVELLVGMAMGMIVLAGLAMMIIVTMHGNSRVDARVEATDNARVGIARIMEELHSACVSPQIAPVQEKSSSNSLIFWHAAAGESTAVEPTPVKSKITYSGGTLTQTDYAKTGGSSPNWVFSTTGTEQKLLANVAPPTGGGPVFSYYKYLSGGPAQLTATELSKAEAETVIIVKVALTASPRSTPVRDAGSAATVQDSATLRLTPPSFNEGAAALPCQ